MSQKSALLSYALIIEKLEHHRCTKKEIIRFLKNHEIYISERTFDRYKESLRSDFGVELLYDTHTGTYYIDRTHSRSLETFLHMIELSQTARIFEEGLHMADAISFESERGFEGIEHVRDVLRAIKDHRVLQLVHRRFDSNESKSHEVQPYLLKEFRNRWYVFGFSPMHKEWRTFGLDRIEKLTVTATTFKPRSNFNPKTHFANVIGLKIQPGDEPVAITLAVEKVSAKYLLSLPMHASQQVISHNDEQNRMVFSYFLIPNYEFYQQVLMMGTKAEIIDPPALRKRFAEVVQEILEKYY